MTKNIYPVFNQILNKDNKEFLLKQRAKVIWITGLSGSGKTTIARQLELELNKRRFLTQILDGDNIRTGLNNNLGFSEEDRLENIRRIAEVTKLFLNCGIICINGFITPTNEIRELAYNIIGRKDIIEVYVNTPIEICEQRDTKGLYAKARKGLIKNFTGIDSPFESPKNPNIEIKTNEESISKSVTKCLNVILPKLMFQVK